MGISMEQYLDFSKEIDRGDCFDRHPNASVAAVVRDFHQEYSEEMAVKMQETLDLCRKATEKASPFRIRQENVIIRKTDVSSVP